MSLYKLIADWASEAEANAEQKRKLRLDKLNKLTKAGFNNALHSLSGEISRHFEVSGNLIIQYTNNIVTEQISKGVNVISQSLDSFKLWLDDSFRMLGNELSKHTTECVQALHELTEGAFTRAEDKATKRQNAIMNMLIATSKQSGAHDLNNADRYLSTIERIRLLETKIDKDNEVLFNTMIGLFENLTEQIQAMRRPLDKQRFSPAPTLEWLMDNADEVIRLGAALNNLRENNVPPHDAKLCVVKSVRSLNDYSVARIWEALESRTAAWGV